jgi:Zn-dependent protease with chaperone function
MGMTIFDSKDPAGRTLLELGALTAIGGSALTNGFMNALDRADERRAERVARQYENDLAEAQWRADDLGRIAIANAQRVAVLEAEVRSLKTALAQRQAYIDRLKKGNR